MPAINANIRPEVDSESFVPDHIAIMMDGNGRWAAKRGLPRTSGHYTGMMKMREAIRNCQQLGIKFLTLYAFSTENWIRPEEEVKYLVHLPKLFFQSEIINELNEANIQIRYIGDISKFPQSIQKIMLESSEMTKRNTGMVVNFAMNYGGRSEIIQTLKNCILEGRHSSQITEEIFEANLYTKDCPAPDIIIRTSGEQRLSNFLLWQSAQAEFWFTEKYWPDFSGDLLRSAIKDCYVRRSNSRC